MSFIIPLAQKFSLVEINSMSYYSIVMANDRRYANSGSISCFLDESMSSSHNILTEFTKKKNLRSIHFIHNCDLYFIHFMRDCCFDSVFPFSNRRTVVRIMIKS